MTPDDVATSSYVRAAPSAMMERSSIMSRSAVSASNSSVSSFPTTSSRDRPSRRAPAELIIR